MTRADALAEYSYLREYWRRDCGHTAPCGCEGVAECCTKCPLVMCRYEHDEGLRGVLNMARDAEVVRYREMGVSPLALAIWYGVSKRTIYRIMHDLHLSSSVGEQAD